MPGTQWFVNSHVPFVAEPEPVLMFWQLKSLEQNVVGELLHVPLPQLLSWVQ